YSARSIWSSMRCSCSESGTAPPYDSPRAGGRVLMNSLLFGDMPRIRCASAWWKEKLRVYLTHHDHGTRALFRKHRLPCLSSTRLTGLAVGTFGKARKLPYHTSLSSRLANTADC